MQNSKMIYRGRYMMAGHNLIECAGFDFADIEQRPSVYEVLRIIDSVPLFLEQHIERMNRSAYLADLEVTFSIDQISQAIRKLAPANSIATGNVKLVLPFSAANVVDAMLAFFIPHSYPTPEMYRNGVEMQTLRAGRPNPNAKIANLPLRAQANQLIAENNIYEVLLISEQELITEGSRSNIFFIRNNHVVTPPKALVLPGITRNVVIDICIQHQIPIAEKEIKVEELPFFEAAFITGTSPKVLPVRRIDSFKFTAQHPMLTRIMRLYDEQIEKYIKQNQY